MIAAGHMAMMNLGFGRVAEVVDVRVLLIVPGVLWTAVFMAAAVASTQTRSIVRHGRFAPSLAT